MPVPAGDTQLVQIMDAALADAAERAGAWLACRPGCTQCCHGAFAINELDALRLAAAMTALHAADPEAAEALRDRARAWVREFGPEFPGDVVTGRIGTTEEEQARFEEFANDAACPALNPQTGLCDVYAGRPMTCRVFGPPVRIHPTDEDLSAGTPVDHPIDEDLSMGTPVDRPTDDNSGHEEMSAGNESRALACCELCFVGAPGAEIARCEMTVPHGLEDALQAELAEETGETGETVVAFALLR